MSDIKAYTVDINLGVKAGLSFVTEQRSLLRFQFYSGYTKVRTIFTVLTLSVPAWLTVADALRTASVDIDKNRLLQIKEILA